ncbi:MAG: hypothetical protein JOZ29_18190 [Deltaproteobacteria bacterium]|nr:hypothetical protein [Deltaproteobacteria bacterium]
MLAFELFNNVTAPAAAIHAALISTLGRAACLVLFSLGSG